MTKETKPAIGYHTLTCIVTKKEKENRLGKYRNIHNIKHERNTTNDA